MMAEKQREIHNTIDVALDQIKKMAQPAKGQLPPPADIKTLLTGGYPLQIDLVTIKPSSYDPATWTLAAWPGYAPQFAVPRLLWIADGIVGVLTAPWPITPDQVASVKTVAVSYHGQTIFFATPTFQTLAPKVKICLSINFLAFPVEM
jgi:hypothetical protein